MKNPFQTEWCRTFYTNHWGKLWLAQTLMLLVVGFAIASSLNGTSASNSNGTGTDGDAQTADAAKIWTCSMHPQIRRDGPGKCPLCGMDLVPVASSSGGMRTISISPDARKLMNIETSPVERRYVTAKVRMVGKVEFDETRLSHITAWVSGRLDRLFVDYTGIEVKKGDHLVSIYSEELYSAQAELIQAVKNQRERPRLTTTLIKPLDLAASAREKLRLLGLTKEQVDEIEQRSTPTEHLTIYSPTAGVVINKLRQEGDRVRTGDRIYTVADLNQVWVKLDAYESDLTWLRYGQEVEFTAEAYPGETFQGRIAFIDPILNEDTRTVKVRVNVPNQDGRLKPAMFVRATVQSNIAAGGRVLDSSLAGKWISPMHPEIVKDEPGKCPICGMPLVRAETLGYVIAEPDEASKPLVVPVSAALVTGTRAIVYVEVPTEKKPTFEGREIVLGPRAGDYYLVRSGLQEGELVVTNGNFKLDSALQISAKPSMMTSGGGAGGGHAHGGGTTQSGETPSSQTALAADVRSQLDRLLAGYDSVTAAIEEAELAKIRTSFKSLGSALDDVNGRKLSGHPKMQWREYSMLLRNDVTEGSDLTTLQNADRVYLSLKSHIQQVREAFGMEQGKPEPQLITLEVPAEFQSHLTRLWKSYLPISAALAANDLVAAQRGIGALEIAIVSVNAENLDADTAAAWHREHANLVKIVSELGKADDLKGARAAFALLSEELVALVKMFGFGGTEPVYELHCPMAFDGRGAVWLQENDNTRNPYFGPTMLKCADRITPISPRNSTQD